MKTNQFLKNTIETFNQILFEFDSTFMGMQESMDSFKEISTTADEFESTFVEYTNPLDSMKVHLGDLRKMNHFLIENYPRLILSDGNEAIKYFNILVYQSDELTERVENFLLFMPHMRFGDQSSQKNITAHFDLIACSSVKLLSTIHRLQDHLNVKAAA